MKHERYVITYNGVTIVTHRQHPLRTFKLTGINKGLLMREVSGGYAVEKDGGFIGFADVVKG
jgi:hypothetical protein